ncbi:MAG: PKD domain-containing protein [Bacteroidales bacterium]
MPFNYQGFSEISPVIVRDGIIFCSDRRFSGIKDRTSFDNRRLYNFYFVARKDTSGWEKPVGLNSERSFQFNNGPLCIAADGRTVYFTSEIETGAPSKRRSFTNHIGIFTGELTGTELKNIRPFRFNDPRYDMGQPSLSPDGRYLFFSSDMPGGQGRSDIYYCEMINGEWSNPVNLGPEANSPENENYPFIHNSGRLYFSSNRPGGQGGLDVYYSTRENGSWSTPVRLSEPVNSPGDDFAFVAQPDLQRGYFSSNRIRNDDIYEFSMNVTRKLSCDTLEKNSYCYEFVEENAVKYDSIPFRYNWKFGDGDTATGPVVEHCYTRPGKYQVSLDVLNLVTNELSENEKSQLLLVEEIEQPYISCPDYAASGQMIKFSADSTYLPGWDISQYVWSFDDETVAFGKNVEKNYQRPGNYSIQLMITSKPEAGGRIREACISKNIVIKSGP